MSSVLFAADASAVADLLSLVAVVPQATVTKTLYDSACARLVLFAMDAGQRLTDHSAARPAFVQVLEGQIEFELEGVKHTLDAHGWVAMTAGAVHAVHALTPARFLLTLLKKGER